MVRSGLIFHHLLSRLHGDKRVLTMDSLLVPPAWAETPKQKIKDHNLYHSNKSTGTPPLHPEQKSWESRPVGLAGALSSATTCCCNTTQTFHVHPGVSSVDTATPENRGLWNVFLQLIHHLLIKSIPPPLSRSLVLLFPSHSFHPSLPFSQSLAGSLPRVTPRLQLIDEERNLPRTGTLLKTGQCVLSVGALADGGAELGRSSLISSHLNPCFPPLLKLHLPALQRTVYGCLFCPSSCFSSPKRPTLPFHSHF